MDMPMMQGMGMEDGMMPQEDEDAMEAIGGDEDGGEGNEETSADGEIMDIVNGLSLEDQAAVKKYAQSLQKDSTPQEPNEEGGDDMQMEGRRRLSKMVEESLGDVMNTDNGDDRPSKELPRAYKRSKRNPFIYK